MNGLTLGDVLEEYDERLGDRSEPTVLTLTEKKGFVSQVERFNKRLATDDTSSYKIVRKYDIAFNPYLLWAGAIAQNVDWEEGIISPAYPTFKVKKGFDPRYVNYRIHSEPMRLRYDSISFGAVPRRRRAATNRFLELEAGYFPSQSEQKRIAAFLDKADAIRRKRQQAIQLADEFLRSVFLDMFGDPVSNPRGWKTTPIRLFGRVVTGNTPSRKRPEYYGDHIEWIKSDNINTPSHFLTSASEYLSESGRAVARTVPEGSILVTCIAGSRDCIGNAAIADREVAFNQQINAIIPNDNVTAWFLYGQILFAKPLIQSASTNSMKGMVSKSKFEQIELLSPPDRLRREFGDIFQKHLELTEKLRTLRDESLEAFSSISQRAFRGDL